MQWVNFLLVRCLTVHNASAQFVYGTELVPITCLLAFTTAPSAERSQIAMVTTLLDGDSYKILNLFNLLKFMIFKHYEILLNTHMHALYLPTV